MNDYLEPADVLDLLAIIPASLGKVRRALEKAAASGEGFDLSGWEQEQRAKIVAVGADAVQVRAAVDGLEGRPG